MVSLVPCGDSRTLICHDSKSYSWKPAWFRCSSMITKTPLYQMHARAHKRVVLARRSKMKSTTLLGIKRCCIYSAYSDYCWDWCWHMLTAIKLCNVYIVTSKEVALQFENLAATSQSLHWLYRLEKVSGSCSMKQNKCSRETLWLYFTFKLLL